MVEEAGTVKCKTTKEIKAMARPEFAANPEKFYPTKVFDKMGYHRAQCGICQNYYWRHTDKKVTCGDSNCDGKYSFIGPGNGLCKTGKKYTYAECWQGFRDSFSSEKVPCTPIKRYPVVARWRNDVDYVAAGIFCFQPYCVTGELDPPANPLVCPQFCVRFNDLDNIGVTGRHYSGFIMMGNQVFNYKDNFKYFKDECLEYHHRWLTETLQIDADEITYIEDVWAGGGNLGPSIEFFVRGLEVGNMVFMQYKTFHDGSREDLDVQIIDTGTGLERIAWLMNGTATSYIDTFRNAYDFIQTKVNVDAHGEIWDKFGPYSCTLNIDEVDDIEKTWQDLSDKMEVPVDDIKKAIQEVKDLYIILDHTRTILITISDGSLPSNVGGGGNVRNILRRCFMIMRKNGWWETLGMEGFLEVFNYHKLDLEGVFGPMAEHKSFDKIIKMEHTRWLTTDDKQGQDLQKLIKQRKGKLTMDDWIKVMQSWGIPADKISEMSGEPIPGSLYYEISTRQERVAKAPEQILYDTHHINETINMYYEDGRLSKFEGKVLSVFINKLQQNKRNLVILDQSAFYPTSGGQLNDTGSLTIKGEKYEVVDVIKVGKCVLHCLDKEVAEEGIVGETVQGEVNMERRGQLQAHHTGTHLVFASCRKVLGPHIWQAGAKKTTEKAHLDITHFQGLTKQQEMDIENQANRLINESHEITKSFMDKAEAEKEYGYTLYQGGVVPGNSLRVVDIAGVDTEACCGTHADNTSEVGWIRIIKSSRISDGIVRLEYVAQERAIQVLNHESNILNTLCENWSVDQTQITSTGERFFKESKHFQGVCEKQEKQILSYQVKLILGQAEETAMSFIRSEQDAPTLYVSQLPAFAEQCKEKKKNMMFINQNYVCGLLGDPTSVKFEEISKKCAELSATSKVCIQMKQVKFDHKIKGQKPVVTKDVFLFMIANKNLNVEKLVEDLVHMGHKEME